MCLAFKFKRTLPLNTYCVFNFNIEDVISVTGLYFLGKGFIDSNNVEICLHDSRQERIKEPGNVLWTRSFLDHILVPFTTHLFPIHFNVLFVDLTSMDVARSGYRHPISGNISPFGNIRYPVNFCRMIARQWWNFYHYLGNRLQNIFCLKHRFVF